MGSAARSRYAEAAVQGAPKMASRMASHLVTHLALQRNLRKKTRSLETDLLRFVLNLYNYTGA